MTQDPSLSDVIRDLWMARVSITLCVLIFLVLAFFISFFVRPVFKASMIVAPADGYALGDYASSSSPDRMVSLPFWRPTDPEGISTDYYRYIYTLQGPSVADILLKDESVVRGIRAENKSWDGKQITPEDVAEYLGRAVTIETLGATPLRRISYTHHNREFASAFLRKLTLVTDQMIRRDRRHQSQARVEYLNKTLQESNNPDHRKIIANLLMQQEHVRMLANLDEAYAAIVVEAPAASPKPYWPNPVLLYPSALLLGLIFGYSIWAVFAARRS